MLQLSKFKHIHFIGIGGIGLSAIAEIFLSRGCLVSGSDMKESDITMGLQKHGIQIYIGHSRDNVEGADLIAYTSAISPDNPELIAAREKGIETASRAEILGALMKEYENSIAIAGTHGKTTTTAMVSLILEKALLDPTILVGGYLAEIGGNVKVGGHEYFITEACEYMDSFLSLRPKVEIILNIDSDHLDYFKDIEHIVNSFAQFTKLVPNDGCIIAYDANPFVKAVIQNLPCTIITFGFNENCDYYAGNIAFNPLGMPSFDLYYQEEKLAHFKLSLPGEHNIANALAAVACCRYLGVPMKIIAETLAEFTGTQRRFDVVGITRNKVRIIDDYAHHPTEIKATLSAAKNIPHNKIWCLFQPHTYTRTLALFDDFAEAFKEANRVIITDIYAAREKNIYRISSKELVAEMKRIYPEKDIYFFADFGEIASFVINNADSDDLVITMGAGDIYKVAEMILDKNGDG
ncbi:MAG: UDP-N-acetylmuramate--L-alanine ligase [Anaerovoracaceae bacterium]|jgi:UDP-N-acetylmuramate--alanine ligase